MKPARGEQSRHTSPPTTTSLQHLLHCEILILISDTVTYLSLAARARQGAFLNRLTVQRMTTVLEPRPEISPRLAILRLGRPKIIRYEPDCRLDLHHRSQCPTPACYPVSNFSFCPSLCLHLLLRATHIKYPHLRLLKLCSHTKQPACEDAIWIPTRKRK